MYSDCKQVCQGKEFLNRKTFKDDEQMMTLQKKQHISLLSFFILQPYFEHVCIKMILAKFLLLALRSTIR